MAGYRLLGELSFSAEEIHMPSPIIRQDKGGKNERWLLEVGDSIVRLTAPDRRILLEWSPEIAANAVLFPSFSRNIKYTGFNVAGRGLYQFSMDGASLKKLRALANRGVAARGPDAARTILRKAIITCAAGLAVLCAGAIFLSITIYEVTTDKSVTDGNPHIVGLVTTLVGFGMLCRGIYGIYQYSQVKKLIA
jgi:hypothetical protein